jgi:hypothetical protein
MTKSTPEQLTEMRDALIRAGLAIRFGGRRSDGVAGERVMVVSDRLDALAGNR